MGEEKKELHVLYKERIANVSITAAAVRGQPKNTLRIIRDFAKDIGLEKFKNLKCEKDFKKALDKETTALVKLMHNFGFARKCLNIFFLEICHNTIVSKKYGLRSLISYLEVPLDNPNEKILRLEARKRGKLNWNWTCIKDLDPDNNEKIQEFARTFMKEKEQRPRVYFDLRNWRRNS